MKRKLFVAINLPEDIKRNLVKKTNKWTDLPVRWARQEKLHFTLAFLGYIDDQKIPEIIETLREAVDQNGSFELNFDTIQPGPDRLDPKMIWLTGSTSPELVNLHEKVGRAIGFLVRNHKRFRPHITLGKVRRKLLAEQNIPIEIKQPFPVSFPVYSIELMSSELSEEGSEYLILESLKLE